MENKKTTELMSRKSTLKSKLMAAVSMLLVSAIMVSVTTYAWFILSTAPEVKGMSTTVGSNGALEMALLNNDTGKDFSKITTNVGDSSAKQPVTKANETWGNLVDLNDASYGLSGITMYPARLNWKEGSTDTLYSRNNLLSYAQYGTDGRIADLIAADSGTNTESGFVSDINSYGVRAIGTAKDQDPVAAALDAAKNGFRNEYTNAKGNALAALNGSAQDIANIAYTHASTKTGETDTYTAEQVASIKNALEGLKTATNNIEKALKYAVMAKDASNNKITAYDTVTLDSNTEVVGEYYGKLTTLRTAIDTALGQINSAAAGEGGKYAWAEIETPYKALLDINSMTLSGKRSDEIRDMDDEAKMNWAFSIMNSGNGLELNVSNGLFSDTANFVDTIVSTAEVKVAVTTENSLNAVITITKTDDVTTAYLVALQTTVNGYTFDGNPANAKAFITDKYGYAVDLAFRSNAEGKLKLSDAAVRVEGDDSNTTMGGGCYFTANAKSDPKALAALRIAFISDENKVLAVGKLDMNADGAAAANKYPVHLYKFSVKDEVLEVTNTAVENDVILDLEANKAVALTAVVFMDGDATSFAQGEASGSLNLQFATTAKLQAMQYTNYANAGLTLDPTTVTVKQSGTVKVPAVKLNGVEVKNGVTWAAEADKESVATVDAATGAVTIKGTGTVTITASYTDGTKAYTGTYVLTVETD